MLRTVLLLILAFLVVRAVSRVLAGVVAGLSRESQQGPPGRTPARGVQMARDPVCGTFVIPDRALTQGDGSDRVFFCSANCRDAYRARRTA